MEINKISDKQIRNRNYFAKIARWLLPTTVIRPDQNDGLIKAQKLMRDEGRDLIVMTPHLSKTDEPREYPVIWSEDEFKNRKILVPNAFDQHTPPIIWAGNLVGLNLYPVVTQDVKNRHPNLPFPVNQGNIGYFRGIYNSTGNKTDPGIIFLAPDAGRKPELVKKAPTRAAEFALTIGGSHAVVLFIGIEINNVLDYSKTLGLNIGKQYTIRIGNAYTNEEILNLLTDFRDKGKIEIPAPERLTTNRRFQGLDQWIYETQFKNLVSRHYLAT